MEPFVGGIGQVMAQEPRMPLFDLHAPLMSLPSIFRSTLETIPANEPYLEPLPELTAVWRERLEELDPGHRQLRVGIAWQGNPKYRGDKQRSIPLRHFAPLAEVPGVRLFSLQKGFGSEQLAEFADAWGVRTFDDLDEQSGPFLDTAAIVKQLDLFITSDSAIAHLAGTLGVRTQNPQLRRTRQVETLANWHPPLAEWYDSS